jgi:hypothetical protein
MKYLGVWQRLGIVLTLLATVLLPTLKWWDVATTSEANMSQFRDECLDRYPAERGAFLEQRAVCNDAYLNRYKPDYIEYMKGGIPFAFGFCLAIWALAYVIYFTTRWVLAGRNRGPI